VCHLNKSVDHCHPKVKAWDLDSEETSDTLNIMHNETCIKNLSS
jgi:hypothetical protein